MISEKYNGESNPITPEMKEAMMSAKRSVDWRDAELKRVIRLRLLSDPGFPAWDVSYCIGVTNDGEVVDVSLPFSQLPKRGYKRAIVAHAKKHGVFAQGLGIINPLVISTLI